MVIFIGCTVFIRLKQKLNLYHTKEVYKDFDCIIPERKKYNKVQSILEIYWVTILSLCISWIFN